MSPPPGVIVAAVRLMWSVPLFGLLVTAVNAYAVYLTAERLPTAPVDANEPAVQPAIRLFDAWAWERTLVIAAGFLVATIVYALLAGTVRRGSRRHPAAVMVLSGALAVIFGLACLWVYANDPVVAFRHESVPVPGPPGTSMGVPWIMPLIAPGWFKPALAGLLATAVAAQLLAVLLLTRTRAGVFVTGLGIQTGDDPDAGDRATRWAARLMVAALGFVAAYAATTAIALQIAAAANTDGGNEPLGSAHLMNLVISGVIAVSALPFAVHGLVLWRGGRRARPLALASTGGFSVPYLLLFGFLCPNNVTSSYFMFDDQSGLTSHVPGWHVPVLYGIFGLAALAQLTALTLLARRRLPY